MSTERTGAVPGRSGRSARSAPDRPPGRAHPHAPAHTSLEANRILLAKTKECLGENVPIDVYLPARVSPGADVVAFFNDFETLRKEGHFGALGASEVSAATLRKVTAAGIKIAVVEIEVSLWTYEQDTRDVIAWSTETQTPVYAYSPLGRGFITRTWKTPDDVPEGSFQKRSPRFQGDNFYKNLELVDVLDQIAEKRGLTTAQLAIAWVCSLGPYVVPIPGSSNTERARLNTEAADIKLSPEEMKEIEAILAQFPPAGGRYPAVMEQFLMR